MVQMLIAGERETARSGEEIPVIDPATEETLESVPSAGREDVDRAVRAAADAFPEWRETDAEERAEKLRTFAGLVKGNAKELGNTLTREQGKPTVEAAGEVQHFVHGLNYYADLATKVRGVYQPLPSTLGRSYGMVVRRPIGVCAGIVPSNFPLTLTGTKLGPALAAGNTIVLKPSEDTPLSMLRLAELIEEAELPPGVVNVVTGGAETGEALVTHPLVRRIAFTGSTATGRRIMELAAPEMKRVTLELGGSDPVIVCPDANLKGAVKTALIARFWNAGQGCLAGKRLFVFDEVYDDFMAALVAGVERYEPGLGWEKAEKPKIRIGPLTTERQRALVMDQLQDALDGGGELLCGGDKPDAPDSGFFLSPTVVQNPARDARVATEEVFGPVLPAWRVESLDDAIERANDTPYGLGSSVWTHDVRTINRVAQEVDAGMTWVNQNHYGYDELPFGGTKQSGYGKEHGIEALDYYFEDKSVVVGGL
ncbi:MAG TPA: aldehyde dehydrogenase family protein [Solirubrobacteraceae bacterium]|nr:aldehyde dehydrogenase family protein [Solirubrobacteraceae bacterium]